LGGRSYFEKLVMMIQNKTPTFHTIFKQFVACNLLEMRLFLKRKRGWQLK
jgi:hypothetical protein